MKIPRKRIVKGLKQFLETMELQILGSLHKMKGGNGKDIKAVARKRKASSKSIKIKLENLKKKLYVPKNKINNYKMTRKN